MAPDKQPALLALWHGLGEIYRTRLKDYPSAIAAFEVAADLDPALADDAEPGDRERAREAAQGTSASRRSTSATC